MTNLIELSEIDLQAVTGGRLTKREERCLKGDACFAYQTDTKGAINSPIVRVNQVASGGAIRGGQRY